MKNYSHSIPRYLAAAFVLMMAIAFAGCSAESGRTSGDAVKGGIIFIYSDTMACQCMLDTSARMNEYLATLVFSKKARSNSFVIERVDFRSARRFNELTKLYGIQFAPALIVIGGDKKPVYAVSGHFDMPDIERFDKALGKAMQ